MDADSLVRMANQIADFFTPYSEEEAITGVETHIRSFWEPRMQRELVALAAHDPAPLSPHVQAAVKRLAENP